MRLYRVNAESEEDIFQVLKESIEKSNNNNKVVNMEVIAHSEDVLKIAVVLSNRDVQILEVWFEKIQGKLAMRIRGNTINKKS